MNPTGDSEIDPDSTRRRGLPAARVFAVALFGIIWAATPALALASSDWSQFQGNAAHTGTVPDGVQAPFKEAWHVDVEMGGPDGRYGLSAPILVGDTVIAVGPTSIVGVDLATGTLSWTIDRDYGPSAPAAVATVGGKQVLVYTEGFGSNPPGSSPSATGSPTSPSPAVGSTSPTGSGGVTGSPSRASESAASPTPASNSASAPFDSHVSAVDLATRKPLWGPIQLDQVSRTGVTIDGDAAFIGDNAGAIHAFDVATGHERWTVHTGGFVDTPLAVSNGRVFVSVQGKGQKFAAIVALNEQDGSVSWRYGSDSDFLATAPAVGAGSVFVGLSGATATVRALDAATGSLRWSSSVNTTLTPVGAPSISSGGVTAQDIDSQIYRFNPRTGSRDWDFALNDLAIQTSPVVSGAQVLFVTNQGWLAALDDATGELVWESPKGNGLLKDPLVTSDEVVLVRGSPRAGLVAFVHDPEGSLVRIASPTTVDPLRLLWGFAAGALPLAAVVLLSGRWLAVRYGPAFDPSGSSDGSDGIDPWESDEAGGSGADPDDDPPDGDRA